MSRVHFTDRVYRFECDTSTWIGKVEQGILQYSNWTVIKHTADGNFVAPSNSMEKVFGPSLYIRWEFVNETKIIYRFYMKVGGTDIAMDDIARDELFIQPNGDIKANAYRFGRLAFTYTGVVL